MRRARATGRPAERGFTLLETIVAVGILALVTVAVAAIFQTVGETVSTGKRLSALNRRAAQIERIMRQDFDRMVRDEGFLVIRNEVARTAWNDATIDEVSDAVPLFEGEPAERRRLRRIDEVMFFARGEFTSAREPLHPGVVASSRTARVYYGHGQKFVDDASDRAIRPSLDEPNAVVGTRLGEASSGLAVNPNEFAADWLLLRQATLLVPRDEVLRDLPRQVAHFNRINLARQGRNGNPQPNLIQYNRVRNHSRQIALQPAAQSVFRSVAALTPDLDDEVMGQATPWGLRPVMQASRRSDPPIAPGDLVVRPNSTPWANERVAPPLFTSGLVDIATVTLQDIRGVVTSPWFSDVTAGAYAPELLRPSEVTLPDFRYPSGSAALPTPGSFESFEASHDPAYSLEVTPTWDAAGAAPNTTTDRFEDQVQQQWMLDALPSVPWREDFPQETGHRVRASDDPPALLPDPPLPTDGTSEEVRLLDAIEQVDQAMLRGSVFLQGCSEFIVEWTYGVIDVDPTSAGFGQPVWFGLRRFADLNENGTYEQGTDQILADLWDNTNRFDGRDLRRMNNEFDVPRDVLGTIQSGDFGLDPSLQASTVVRRETGAAGSTALHDPIGPSAEYVFGYFRAGNDSAGVADVRPWPWPTLIRVTLRLVDPEDRGVETTYQATFRVPTGRGL